MHIAEFQEFGFEYEVQFKKDLSPAEQEAWMEQFLTAAVLPCGSALGGWVREGFITAHSSGSATEDDRKAVEDWLTKNVPDATIRVSELKDAWYVQD